MALPIKLKSMNDRFLGISDKKVELSNDSSNLSMDKLSNGIKLYKDDQQLCEEGGELVVCDNGNVFEVESVGDQSKIKSNGMCMTASDKVRFEECNDGNEQLFKIINIDGNQEEPEAPENKREKSEESPKESEASEDAPGQGNKSEEEPETPEDAQEKSEESPEEPETPEDAQEKSEESPEEPEASEDEPQQEVKSQEEPETPEDAQEKSEESPEEPEASEDEPQQEDKSQEELEAPEDAQEKSEESPEEPEASEDEPQQEDKSQEEPENPKIGQEKNQEPPKEADTSEDIPEQEKKQQSDTEDAPKDSDGENNNTTTPSEGNIQLTSEKDNEGFKDSDSQPSESENNPTPGNEPENISQNRENSKDTDEPAENSDSEVDTKPADEKPETNIDSPANNTNPEPTPLTAVPVGPTVPSTENQNKESIPNKETAPKPTPLTAVPVGPTVPSTENQNKAIIPNKETPEVVPQTTFPTNTDKVAYPEELTNTGENPNRDVNRHENNLAVRPNPHHQTVIPQTESLSHQNDAKNKPDNTIPILEDIPAENNPISTPPHQEAQEIQPENTNPITPPNENIPTVQDLPTKTTGVPVVKGHIHSAPIPTVPIFSPTNHGIKPTSRSDRLIPTSSLNTPSPHYITLKMPGYNPEPSKNLTLEEIKSKTQRPPPMTNTHFSPPLTEKGPLKHDTNNDAISQKPTSTNYLRTFDLPSKMRTEPIQPNKTPNFSYDEPVVSHQPVIVKKPLNIHRKVIRFSPSKRIKPDGNFVYFAPAKVVVDDRQMELVEHNFVQNFMTDEQVLKMELEKRRGRKILGGKRKKASINKIQE